MGYHSYYNYCKYRQLHKVDMQYLLIKSELQLDYKILINQNKQEFLHQHL
jgi:hypothetical protein